MYIYMRIRRGRLGNVYPVQLGVRRRNGNQVVFLHLQAAKGRFEHD